MVIPSKTRFLTILCSDDTATHVPPTRMVTSASSTHIQLNQLIPQSGGIYSQYKLRILEEATSIRDNGWCTAIYGAKGLFSALTELASVRALRGSLGSIAGAQTLGAKSTSQPVYRLKAKANREKFQRYGCGLDQAEAIIATKKKVAALLDERSRRQKRSGQIMMAARCSCLRQRPDPAFALRSLCRRASFFATAPH